MSEPSAKGSRLYRSPVDWADQSGIRDDRPGMGPMVVQSEEREMYSEIGWNSALCGASAGAGMVPICDRGETMGLTEGLTHA
jgi:hypothetical protein